MLCSDAHCVAEAIEKCHYINGGGVNLRARDESSLAFFIGVGREKSEMRGRGM